MSLIESFDDWRLQNPKSKYIINSFNKLNDFCLIGIISLLCRLIDSLIGIPIIIIIFTTSFIAWKIFVWYYSFEITAMNHHGAVINTKQNLIVTLNLKNKTLKPDIIRTFKSNVIEFAATVGRTPKYSKIFYNKINTENFTEKELKVLLEHEAGHIKYWHNLKDSLSIFLLGACTIYITYFINICLIPILPVIFIIFILIYYWISRTLEYTADRYSVHKCDFSDVKSALLKVKDIVGNNPEGKTDCFIMNKLSQINLSFDLFRYYPTMDHRIDKITDIMKKENK